jgi:hypothetical protein
MRWKNPKNKIPLYLNFRYAADPDRPQIALPLRKIDTGTVITRVFKYYGSIASHTPQDIPEAYLVTDHQGHLRDILARHHIICEAISRRNRQVVEIPYVLNRNPQDMKNEEGCPPYSVKARREAYTLNRGDIMVRLQQPAQRLIPLLMELQSSSGLFTYQPHCQLVRLNQDFFIYRIPARSDD